MSEHSKRGMGPSKKNPDGVLDQTSGIQMSMSREHHEIHEGNGWEFFHKVDAIALNANLKIQIDTGDNEIHLKQLRVWGDAAKASLTIFEAPTHTTGSAACNLVNRNRLHPQPLPADFKIFTDPTNIADGTIIEESIFGGGAGVGQTAIAGSGAQDEEFVFKKNTTYIIRATNLEDNDRSFSVNGFFYFEFEEA